MVMTISGCWKKPAGEQSVLMIESVSCVCAGDSGMLMDGTPHQMGFVCVRGRCTGEVSRQCECGKKRHIRLLIVPCGSHGYSQYVT